MTLAFDIGDRGADISPCGRYRYTLWRRWDCDRPSVLWIMLNPSTADAAIDDPTIRRCIDFARRWDMGGIRVCNLYPWRATDPRDLPRGPEVIGEQAGLRNSCAIAEAVEAGGRIIVAWGASEGPHLGRGRLVCNLLAGLHVEALALTKHGMPRHPLYVRGDTHPLPYSYPEPRR